MENQEPEPEMEKESLIRQIHECFKLRSMIDINPTPFFAFLAHKMGDNTRGGSKVLAPVVQRLDNAIHRINRYPADKC